MSDFGQLKDYIVGASIKRLSTVECDPARSHQHELHGTKAMKTYLGEEGRFNVCFIRLNDDEEKNETGYAEATWYDSRAAHPVRSEYRFYYQSNPALALASAGDPVAVILKKDGGLFIISAPEGSQSELELRALFGEEISTVFNALDFSSNKDEVSVTKRFILEKLGFEIRADFGRDYLGRIEAKFGRLDFPTTRLFSELARELAEPGDLCDYGTVDEALISWWNTETAMFLQLEKALIEKKLFEGFEDVDDFLSFSQTVRQRRSSRAGKALENHLESMFRESGIRHSREPRTENNTKPDFLFPSIDNYRDTSFPPDRLTMLGVKTTCKERWRQVLSEADRIPEKHLLTLEPKISFDQTKEMMKRSLQLVIPQSIHTSYTKEQRDWLWNLETFVNRVLKLQ